MAEHLARRRATKRQKELLVEELHQHLDMARGNSAQREVVGFWATLTHTLNGRGCQRTTQEWQHVWNIMKIKAKAKARKIRDHIAGTGGGPAAEVLSSTEEKIIEIVGPGSVYGIANLEFGLPPAAVEIQNQQINPADVPPPPPQPLQVEVNPADVPSPPPQPPRNAARRVRRVLRRPTPSQSLTEALARNHQQNAQFYQDVALAIRAHADATIRAAEIIAAAIGSIGGIVVDQD